VYVAQNKDPSKADHGYPTGTDLRNSLFVLAACNLFDLLCTFLILESKDESLSHNNSDRTHKQWSFGPCMQIKIGYPS
jgi:MFS transporter, PHS family, inorganic phosphate transporter